MFPARLDRLPVGFGHLRDAGRMGHEVAEQVRRRLDEGYGDAEDGVGVGKVLDAAAKRVPSEILRPCGFPCVLDAVLDGIVRIAAPDGGTVFLESEGKLLLDIAGQLPGILDARFPAFPQERGGEGRSVVQLLEELVGAHQQPGGDAEIGADQTHCSGYVLLKGGQLGPLRGVLEHEVAYVLVGHRRRIGFHLAAHAVEDVVLHLPRLFRQTEAVVPVAEQAGEGVEGFALHGIIPHDGAREVLLGRHEQGFQAVGRCVRGKREGAGQHVVDTELVEDVEP